MGLLEKLDALDARVIGRGDPNWNSPTPRPWTPEIGPLAPVRATIAPYAWALCASGALSVTAVIAFRGDLSWWGVAFRAPWLLLGWCAARGVRSSRFIDAALEVPPDVPVGEPGRGHWILAIALAVGLLAPVVVGAALNGDAASFVIYAAYAFGVGLSLATQLRRIARLEHERGVDYLRARRRRGFRAGLYTRQRTPASSGEAAVQP